MREGHEAKGILQAKDRKIYKVLRKRCLVYMTCKIYTVQKWKRRLEKQIAANFLRSGLK